MARRRPSDTLAATTVFQGPSAYRGCPVPEEANLTSEQKAGASVLRIVGEAIPAAPLPARSFSNDWGPREAIGPLRPDNLVRSVSQ